MSSGKELMVQVSDSIKTLYGEDLLTQVLSGQDEVGKKASLQSFLLAQIENGNQMYDAKSKSYKTPKDIIFNDTDLKLRFMNKLFEIAKLTDCDFKYAYCFLRNSKKAKSGFTLDFGFQYQTELNILAKKGYRYVDCDVVFENNKDKFKKRMCDGILSVDFEQDNFDLNKPINKTELGNDKDSNAKNTLENLKTILSNVVFSYIVFMDDKSRNDLISKGVSFQDASRASMRYIEVNKDKLLKSIEATCFSSYYDKTTGQYKTSFKEDNIKMSGGLKDTIKIAMIHRAYAFIINNSTDDDDVEQVNDNQNQEAEQPIIKEAKAVNDEYADDDIE